MMTQLDLFAFALENNFAASVARENYRSTTLNLPSTQNERIQANLLAIQLLADISSSNREPHQAELDSLAKFTGWGGCHQIFEQSHNFYSTLKQLLTEEEYTIARSSILDSFYTPFPVIDFMWSLAQKIGFSGRKIAELGAGIGNFLGRVPEKINPEFIAIEIDPIASKIMTQLYPNAEIINQSLEEVRLEENIDLFIGNVPFGKTSVYDRNYHNFNLHNYFIARGLDALRHGGLAVILTSGATLDSSDSRARKDFAEKASLELAIRLPNNAFAGTEVVSDIIVLRKGGIPKERFTDLTEVDTADNTGSLFINEYFARHPDMILGKNSNTGRMYGKTNTPTVLPDPQKTTAESFAQILNGLKAQSEIIFPEFKLSDPETLSADKTPDAEIKINYDMQDCNIFSHDDEIYQFDSATRKARLLLDKKGQPLTPKEKNKILSYIRTKDALNALIEKQLSPLSSDQEVEAARDLFNLRYDAHVLVYGIFSNKLIHKNIIEDPNYLKLSATEYAQKVIEEKDGIKISKKHYIKGDIFFKRTQFPWKEPVKADNIVDAGLISYAYRHTVDLSYIAELMQQPQEEVKKALLETGEFFFNPETNSIELKSQYLSGNIQQKIDIARITGHEENIPALEKVLPTPLHIEDIDFSLGAFWIPSDIVASWIKKEFSCTVKIDYKVQEDRWSVTPDYRDRYSVTDYKVEDLDLFSLVELILNLKDPVIKKTVYENDQKKEVVDQEATMTARRYKIELSNLFHEYVMNDVTVSTTLESRYNMLFNKHVVRKYDAPKFDVYPGAATIVDGQPYILREHQKKGITRCIEGCCLLAHCVGAGKTGLFVTAACELRRLKLASKPMIVVQNSTLQQYADFVPQLYPNAKVLIATKNDLAAEKRKRFLSRIATGDWDMIVIAQSSFDMLENDPDLVREYMQAQVDELESVIEDSGGGRMKDIERQIRSLKNKIKKLADKIHSEDVIYFHQLGVDALFIDEAHAYKKNFFVTKKGMVKGLDRGASQKAFSLSLKISQIREKTNGRNIFFATGTAVSNTLAELWNMVRYVSPETLVAYHIETFDRFASTFTETETSPEIDAAGSFKMVTRFSKYQNIIELSKMFQAAADVVLSEDLGSIPRPPIKGGRPEQVTIPRSEIISQLMSYFSDLYNWYEHCGEKKKYSYIPLLIHGQARKATVDVRLLDHRLPDDPGSKVNICVAKVIEKYHVYNGVKGTQAIFCDLYQNASGGCIYFNVYEEIKRKLIAAGIPQSEIAIINDYKTDKSRQDVFDQVNAGTIRVIMGSTGKLGTGVNIQERLACAHHLDCPYRPSDMEQRNGRILRQGNSIAEVEIFFYGVAQTLDAGMYQILTRKQKFINDAMKGRQSRSATEIQDAALDYATFSAAISGNDMLKRKVSLETRLKELNALELQFRRTVRKNAEYKSEIAVLIPEIQKNIQDLQDIINRKHSMSNDTLDIVFNGEEVAGNKEDKVSWLNHHINSGLWTAIATAKRSAQTCIDDMGIVQINGLKLKFSAICECAWGRAIESTATIAYKLAEYSFHNQKIRTGGNVQSGIGFMASFNAMLKHKEEEIIAERDFLQCTELKYQHLTKTVGTEKFAYLDEQKSIMTELDQLLCELQKDNLLVQQQIVRTKPELDSYIKTSINLIPDSIVIEDTETVDSDIA